MRDKYCRGALLTTQIDVAATKCHQFLHEVEILSLISISVKCALMAASQKALLLSL